MGQGYDRGIMRSGEDGDESNLDQVYRLQVING